MFNESEIPFESLYHPELIAFYKVFWDVSLVYTTVCFFSMLFLVITQSGSDMGVYKWYLVHQLLWSFGFELHLSIWKPVTLWPFLMAYSAGWWSTVTGDTAYLPLVIQNSIIAGMGFSIYISAFHRYIQVAPFSWFYRVIYCNLWIRFGIYILVFITLQCVIALPMYLMKVPKKVLRKAVLRLAPQLEFFFNNEPSLAGYDRSVNNTATFFTYGLVLILGIVSLSIVLLSLNYLRMLRKNKNLLSSGTLKLQRMLFKTFFAQVFLASALLILPITLALMFSLLGYQWAGSFSLFAIMVMASHTVLEYVSIIYYIRPYRTFVKRVVFQLLKKNTKNPTFIVALNTVVVPNNCPRQDDSTKHPSRSAMFSFIKFFSTQSSSVKIVSPSPSIMSSDELLKSDKSFPSSTENGFLFSEVLELFHE